MNIQKETHHHWRLWNKFADKTHPFGKCAPIGKDHYFYSSSKGKISLVSLPDYFRDKKTLWEAYCLEGDLFEGEERFKTKKEAEVYIKKLLEEVVK